MRAFATFCLALLLATPAFASGALAEKPKAEAHERKLTSSPAWLAVDPITVAIMRQNRIQGIFLIEFGLDIPDAKLHGRASETLPRLRDAWLRAMSDFAATRVRIGRQADLDALTQRLQATTDQMLAGPGARVLLQQAVVRQN
jgi:flagellar basal body-associated protein FliL